MRKLLLALLFILYTTMLTAQETIDLWPAGAIPNSKPASIKEEQERTEIVRIKNVQQPTIAVYLPSKRNATGQAVVVCPGGGYGVLAYDWEGTDVAKWLNAHGIAAVVLKYRLPDARTSVTPHLTPLLDAQRALRLVRHHAGQWNIRPDRVGIMGFSAGGHLASTAGTRFDTGKASSPDPVERYSSRPDFMILMYPVITLSKPFMHKGSATNLLGANPPAGLAESYSNDLQVGPQTPPTFLVHATDDAGVPVENSLVFYQALVRHKVPAELHVYAYGGHGFGLAVGRGYLSSWTERCLDWLKALHQ
ncbi:MAG TPA: alpha/beta hydrolase [Chitinophagaceae bacterium]